MFAIAANVRSRVACVLGVLCAFGVAPAVAAGACTDTWQNTSGGSWNTPGNWSAGVPTSADDVCITVSGTYSVTLTGTTGLANTLTLGASSGSGTQTLDVEGTPGNNGVLSLATNSTVQARGQLILDTQTSGGYASLFGGSGAVLSNSGSIVTQNEGGVLDYLEMGLTNNPGGTVDVHTGEFRQDTGTTTTNDGTWTVDPGGSQTLITGTASFLNDAGTVTDNGSITLTGGASWSEAGGSETGNPVSIFGGGFTDGGAGTSGSFDLIDAVNVSGTIAAGETVSFTGIPGHNAVGTVVGGLTNDGTLVLDSQSGGGYTDLAGNPVINNGTIDTRDAGSVDYLDADLTNHGAVHVQSGELRQEAGTTTTNDGSFTTAAAITPGYTLTSGSAVFVNNSGGAVTNSGAITLSNDASWTQNGGSETGHPVNMFSGTLTDGGAGSGAFDLIDSTTISGTIAPGETVDLTGIPGHNAFATLASPGVINNGTLILDSQNSGGYTDLTGNPLTNNGTVRTQVETGGNLDYLEASLTNDSGAFLTVASGELRQDANTTTDNAGTFTVAGGAMFNLTSGTGAVINDATGTVIDSGSISLLSGSWTQNGGSETGNPVSMFGGTLTDHGAGASGTFDLLDNPTVAGTIAPGETVDLTGVPGHNAVASLQTPGVINNGTLILDSQNSGGYADLAGSLLTNNGTITTQVESGGNLDYLEAPLTNNPGASLTVASGELRQDANTTTTNKGAFTVGSGALLDLTTGGDSFLNDSTGTVSDSGQVTLTSGGSWNQNGGSETGNPVSLFSGTLTDGGAGASGSFDLLDSSTIAGTIASNETVDLTGIPGHDAIATLSGLGVTNNGTLILDSQTSGGYAVLAGSLLTNNGVMTTQVESGGNLDYLEANVVNSGTVDVTSGEFRQDTGTTTTNNGNVVIGAAGQFNLTSASATFNQQSGATMTFDIAGPSSVGALNLTGGAVFHLNGGTASGILQGGYTPTVGTEFDVITGPWGTGSCAVGHGFTGDFTHPGFIGLVLGLHSSATALGSSANPSTLGAPVTFTATVTAGPGGSANPTGTVKFLDNGASIGTGTLSTTGGVTTATLTTSALAVGTHPITASYAGDSSYAPSASSPAVNQVVGPVVVNSTSTTLASSQNPSQASQPVKFTATVTRTSGSANPTGTVTFYDNGASLGSGTLSTSGGVTAATLTTSSLTVGSHPITAAYGGDSNYSGSTTSSPLNQAVNLNATSTSLASSQNPSVSGQALTLTATVAHATGSATPTGTVTFYDNGSPIGSATVSSAGTATLTSSTLAAGTHPLTATYGGDGNYSASTSSPALSQVVNALVHAAQNHPLTVTGAGQGGSVTVNGTTCSSTCTLSYGNNQVVTLTATAKPGWTFAGWTGGGCIGTGSCVVTMSAAQSVQALFIQVAPPVFQHNSDAAPISGNVTVRLPGTNRFVPLSKAKQIPLGAVIDATHGVVRVVLAKRHGGTLEGQYWTGQFSLSQSRSGQVTAKLRGGNLPACRRLVGHARDAVAASHKPHHRRRSLWSNVHGTFTTQGSVASGSVRGTEWLTVDYCEGTSVTVVRGAVLVTDLRRHRSTLVRAGHSIFISS